MSTELEPWSDEEIDEWLDKTYRIEVVDNRVNFYAPNDSWYEFLTPRTIHALCRRLIDAATKAGTS